MSQVWAAMRGAWFSLEKCLCMMRPVRHCCSLAAMSAELSWSPLLQDCAKEKVRNCLGFTLLPLNRLAVQLFKEVGTCAFFQGLTCARHPQSHRALSLAEVQIWGLWVALFALGVVHVSAFLGICSCSSSWARTGHSSNSNP